MRDFAKAKGKKYSGVKNIHHLFFFSLIYFYLLILTNYSLFFFDLLAFKDGFNT